MIYFVDVTKDFFEQEILEEAVKATCDSSKTLILRSYMNDIDIELVSKYRVSWFTKQSYLECEVYIKGGQVVKNRLILWDNITDLINTTLWEVYNEYPDYQVYLQSFIDFQELMFDYVINTIDDESDE